MLHSIRHKDAIALSMIDGKKGGLEQSDSIVSSRPLAAILLVVLLISASLFILKNFDTQKQTLILFGKTLQLGENESGETKNLENGTANDFGSPQTTDEDEDEDDGDDD